jgi:membrane-associated phospholipid phosphatase
LALLALLAYGNHSVQVLDARILAKLVAAPGSREEAVASVARHLGDLPAMLAMLALACAIGVARGRRDTAVAALVVVAGANLTTQILKLLVSHPRIRAALGADQLAWDGFPSGHVTAVASIVIAYAFVVPGRLRPVVFAGGACLVAVVAWAVLSLDMHYPSDVLGGVLVAAGWGFAALAGLRFVEGGYRSVGRRQLDSRAAISVK